MIKLRATRTLSGDYGSVRRGEVFQTSAASAKYLVRRGYAVTPEAEKLKATKPKPQASA